MNASAKARKAAGPKQEKMSDGTANKVTSWS